MWNARNEHGHARRMIAFERLLGPVSRRILLMFQDLVRLIRKKEESITHDANRATPRTAE